MGPDSDSAPAMQHISNGAATHISLLRGLAVNPFHKRIQWIPAESVGFYCIRYDQPYSSGAAPILAAHHGVAED